jgi:hypothetical protein
VKTASGIAEDFIMAMAGTINELPLSKLWSIWRHDQSLGKSTPQRLKRRELVGMVQRN